VKSKVAFSNGSWNEEYKSITHNSVRERFAQYTISEFKSINSTKNKFTFVHCGPELFEMTDDEKAQRKVMLEGEDDYSVLDVYMNGNRIVTMDKVIEFNCDD